MQYPVELTVVEAQPVTYLVQAVGSLEAFEIVQLTARVAGVVEQVHFREGRSVAKNQGLVEIEPERYKLAVAAAKATYEKAMAVKADAEAGLRRREDVTMRNPGLIPGEEIETWRTKTLAAIADVAQTRATLEQAELNLHDAFVKSPVAGVIQTRSVQTGQYVQPGTVLATLIRRDPLLLKFKLQEQDATKLAAGMPANFQVRDDSTRYTATIRLVASAAEDASRMVQVTAEVHDTRKPDLRPGSFAEVSVPIGSPRARPVIPQTSIRPSERGFLAYVVNDGIAHERILTLGLRTESGDVEVVAGLEVGEKLVVRGAEALREGVRVRNPGAEKTQRGSTTL